jgi:hypothetical protein
MALGQYSQDQTTGTGYLEQDSLNRSFCAGPPRQFQTIWSARTVKQGKVSQDIETGQRDRSAGKGQPGQVSRDSSAGKGQPGRPAGRSARTGMPGRTGGKNQQGQVRLDRSAWTDQPEKFSREILA